MLSAYSLSFELFESLSLFFPSPWNCVSDTAIIGDLIFRRQVEDFSTCQFEYKPSFFTQFSLNYACCFSTLTMCKMIPSLFICPICLSCYIFYIYCLQSFWVKYTIRIIISIIRQHVCTHFAVYPHIFLFSQRGLHISLSLYNS